MFFFVFGVFGASEVLAAKKDGGKHAERLVFPNHWNLVSCEKHSRKVFIFQFLLGESGEAPEMKSHVWKLRFCCLKLGESSGTSQGLTAKGETSCEIKGTA